MQGDFTPGSVYVVSKPGDVNHGRAVRIKARDGEQFVVTTASKKDGKPEELRYAETELVFLQGDTRR
jgi:hypothetical protein